MIVTPDAPVNAVNTAQETSVTIASPPGIHPKNAFESATNLSGVLLSARMYPAKVNNGMARRVGVLARRYNSTIIAEVSMSAAEKAINPIAPIIENNGAPKMQGISAMA